MTGELEQAKKKVEKQVFDRYCWTEHETKVLEDIVDDHNGALLNAIRESIIEGIKIGRKQCAEEIFEKIEGQLLLNPKSALAWCIKELKQEYLNQKGGEGG